MSRDAEAEPMKPHQKTHAEARRAHVAQQARRDALAKMRAGEVVTIKLAWERVSDPAVDRLCADLAAADAASATRVCADCGHDPEAVTYTRSVLGTILVVGHGVDCPADPYRHIRSEAKFIP